MARAVPNNPEAEMSVLGVAFIARDQVDKICESVTSDMFYDERNRIVFEAIKSLHDDHSPIDITTLKNQIGNELNSLNIERDKQIKDLKRITKY